MPNLKLGIVGLPNVGKSTLFNALTQAGAAADNYPFCTVDPNVGVVEVPDERLDLLFERVRPRERVPAVVTFVDIAGLVKGAAEGEGLGNQFLANIREVHAIVHVVRCHDDTDVTHVLGDVDPVRDREVVNYELILADLQVIEKRLDRAEKAARTGQPEAVLEAGLLQRVREVLEAGRPARLVKPKSQEEARLLRTYNLLSAKPELYVANISEADLAGAEPAPVARLRAAVEASGEVAEVVPLCARIEAELMELDAEHRREFLDELGIAEPGLHALIGAGYRLLNLISYFTAGEKQVRAWTIRRGSTAPQAAGEIHSDFERGFIRAETLGWEDFVTVGSEKAARDTGRMRSEGKDYVVRDGDILLFRFNV